MSRHGGAEMNSQSSAKSHASLGWVKPELDHLLQQVRQEIDVYIDAPEDLAPVRRSVESLHQVCGALRMLELDAPAMVSEELEQLANSLIAGQLKNRDDACAMLLRGTVLLPDYLERLQNGHREIPVVLLPILNEIRALRGESPLNESVMSALDAVNIPATAEEIEHARGSLSGHNRELLDTVGGAVKEELLRIKDALDLHLRTNNPIDNLRPQLEELTRVADTLAMMGLTNARELVLQQRTTLQGLLENQQQLDENTVLDIAGALLQVDAALDNLVDTLGVQAQAGGLPVLSAESRQTLDALINEAKTNLNRARDLYVGFIETNWNHEQLSQVPQLLAEVIGALQILEFTASADYLKAISLYTQRELIEKKHIPSERQLDALADAMASLEYYLDALKDRRYSHEETLDVTRASLETLDYWPLPEEIHVSEDRQTRANDQALEKEPIIQSETTEVDHPQSLDTLTESQVSHGQVKPIEMDEASTAFMTQLKSDMGGSRVDQTQAPTSGQNARATDASGPVIGGFDLENDEVGDDIREVFLEEFEEELGNLSTLIPAWKKDLQSSEALRPIRRVFHTLKGSGRLVGARMLGEFSWKIENMLNRVLDGSRPPSDDVAALVQQSYEALPEFLAALQGKQSIQTDVAAMEAVADALANGEEVRYSPKAPDAQRLHPRSVETELQGPSETPAPRQPTASVSTPEQLQSVDHGESVASTQPASAGTPFTLDPVLRDILEAELRMHLETMQSWLNSAADGERAPTEQLLRAVHTMNGAFAMTDAPEVIQVTQPTESFVKRSLAAQQAISNDGLDGLRAVSDLVSSIVGTLSHAEPRIPPCAALAERIRLLADTLPEAQWPPQEHLDRERALEEAEHARWEEEQAQAAAEQHRPLTQKSPEPKEESAFSAPISEPEPELVATSSGSQLPNLGPLDRQTLDLDLVDIFVEEGRDILDLCDTNLFNLRQSPNDAESIAGLQRSLHTLKGGARMAGINAIGDLGHTIESLLEAVMAHRTSLDRQDLRLLESAFDRLHHMLLRTREHGVVAMPSAMITLFAERIAGKTINTQAIQAAEATEEVDRSSLTEHQETEASASSSVERPADSASSVQGAESSPLSSSSLTDAPLEEDAPLARPSQEQVRVRADLLDSLVGSAGEVAIYRSRLEQQLGAFRAAMVELDRTNTRLRDQLRRLDLETEAQIVARYQREHDQPSREFDPLELDRFSTLQQLSRALNESAADLTGLQGVLDELSRQYDNLLQQQSRVSSELQDGLMRARMIPFDTVVPRLRRVVRQAASDTGKQAQLFLEGTRSELDRKVLDRMIAPLEHMLRNSVAHGLETPEQRRKQKKTEEGKITIQLRHEGSEIVVEVTDDGSGLDRKAILRRAQERGLVPAKASLSEPEIDNLIFASGLSTSSTVSQLAGRGVGMDVVRNEVRQLGGTVEIQSTPGQGVCFTLRLPQTLAVTQAVFVRIGESIFAVPVGSVSGIGRISRERYSSDQITVYRYANEEYALNDLGILVGQAPAAVEGQAQIPLLLVRSGELRAAVAIDEVLGSREIVVKPVGMQIASVPGIYGGTITGDGRVIVILDVAPLVRRHLTQPIDHRRHVEAPEKKEIPVVMVVDDSLTMRKVTSRVLERNNLEVMTARDGIEALEIMEERVPDLMLLDIEMPRMDGYELATAMRNAPRLKSVPIVMITSRSGDKHRQRALKIGVQRYLGKPYQELDLMRNVFDLLGIARARE